MGPFTPLFSSGVPAAVMCCKDFPQKNLCCMVSLLPFKKSAMSEIYLLSGSSSSLVFFLLFLSALSLLLCLWGWERWLVDSTFLLWTDYDDCCLLAVFVFLFQGRLEHNTITFRICFVAWLPPAFSVSPSSFGAFRVFVVPA